MPSLKTKLSDFTFIIPYRFDCIERYENLKFVYSYLYKRYNAKFMIVKQRSNINVKSEPKIEIFENTKIYDFGTFNIDYFHRTKMINLAVDMLTTKYFCVHDTDALFPTKSIEDCYLAISNYHLEYLYVYGLPFNGIVKYLPHEIIDEIIDEINIDFSKFESVDRSFEKHYHCGLSFMMKTNTYKEIGGMDDRYKKWGNNDWDLYYNCINHGSYIFRSADFGYHIYHPRNGIENNEFMDDNEMFLKERIGIDG